MTAVVSRPRDSTGLKLDGRFDATSTSRFSRSIRRVLKAPNRIVTVDLRNVRFIDMHAIRELLELDRHVTAEGGQLHVLASDVVRVIFELTDTRLRLETA